MRRGDTRGVMQIHPMAMMRLLLPAALISGGLWLRIFIDNLGVETQVVLTYLPYLLCVTALFLAYQFNRCRMMLATLGMGVFYWLATVSFAPGRARTTTI